MKVLCGWGGSKAVFFTIILWLYVSNGFRFVDDLQYIRTFSSSAILYDLPSVIPISLNNSLDIQTHPFITTYTTMEIKKKTHPTISNTQSSTRMNTTMWGSYLATCIQKPDKRMSYFNPSPRGPRTCDRNARMPCRIYRGMYMTSME